MSTAREREARTIREKMEGKTSLTPSMRTQGMASYAYARPGDVGYDRYAGSGLRQLAASLSGLEPAIHNAFLKKLDADIAEDHATASDFFYRRPDAVKNMESWRTAAESDPEVLNMSPWVKRYTEQEVLRSRALAMDAEMKDAFVTGPMVNERDPAKVQAWTQEFTKGFMRREGLDAYPDKLMLAESFTKHAAESTASLMDRHTRQVESQNANILEQQMFQNVADILAGKMNPLTGGYDTNLPQEREGYTQSAAHTIVAAAEEMKKLGYPQDKILGMLGKAVLHGNHSVAVAEQLANTITVNVGGKQVSLLSQPGIAKGIEKLKDEEADRAFKAWQRGVARREDAIRQSQRNAVRQAVLYAEEHGDLSPAEALKMGMDPLHIKTALEHNKAVNAARHATPDNMRLAVELERGIRDGTRGLGDIYDAAISGDITADTTKTLYTMALNRKEQGGNLEASHIRILTTEAVSLTAGVSMEEALLYAYGNKKPDSETMAGILKDVAPGIGTAFSAFVAEQQARKNRADAAPTSTEMEIYAQQFRAEQMPKTVAAAKEKYKPATDKDVATLADMMNNKVEKIQGVRRLLGLVNVPTFGPASNRNMIRSITALNTLFGSSVPTEDVRDFRTVQDVFQYARDHFQGMSWQQGFHIATGMSTEEAGVLSAAQAASFIESYFREQGYDVKREKYFLKLKGE